MSEKLKLLFLLQICFLGFVLSRLWLNRRHLKGQGGHWQNLKQSKLDLQRELAKELLRAKAQGDFLLGKNFDHHTGADSGNARPDWPNWNEKTSFREVLQLGQVYTKKELEKNYRDLIKRYHPDRFSSLGAEYERKAHETLLIVQDAKQKAEDQLSKNES